MTVSEQSLRRAITPPSPSRRLLSYGLDDRIKKSKTAADYIDLIRRTGMLAEAMANVLAKLAENSETLKPIDSKTLDWIKKI